MQSKETINDRQASGKLQNLLVPRMGSSGNSRRLVEVHNGGSIPNEGDRIFLTYPADLDGSETEGGPSAALVDVSTSIPVLLIRAPAVAGDLLIATAVGGRWAAEKGIPPLTAGYPCAPCSIPQTSLTLSWVNPLIGNGSTPLTYTAPGLWVSSCTNQLQYQLRCTENQIELRVIYFLSGSCPTGRSQYCSNLLAKPLYITLANSICSPFFVTWTPNANSCPVISSNGYTSFTITE